MKKQLLLKLPQTALLGSGLKKLAAVGLFTLFTGFSASAQWVVYEANQLPNEFTESPFITSSPSNAAIVPAENAIVDDPDNVGNKLLRFYIDGTSTQSTFLWRQNFPSTNPTAATVVVRAKGIESALRSFELDLDFGGFRETIYIIHPAEGETNGKFTFNVARGDNQNAALPINPLEWHTYRFTKDGGTVKMYIDENNTPIATGTSTTGGRTQNYFRIGDGSSSTDPVGAFYDYIAWDHSGAYSPSEKALPVTLILSAKHDLEKAGSLSVYPNPSTDRFALTHPAARKGATIDVYAANGLRIGSVVAQQGATSTTIDLTSKKGGLYTIVYSEGSLRSSTRVIKQ